MRLSLLLLVAAASVAACSGPADSTSAAEAQAIAPTSAPAAPWPLSVSPVATDPALSWPSEASYVWGATGPRKNVLVVFFPGSLGAPSGYTVFGAHAATLGYDVIDLTYDNTVLLSEYCPDPRQRGSASLEQAQSACFGAARGTILFGPGSTYGRDGEPGAWAPPAPYQGQPAVKTTIATSTTNRLVAMLEYLGQRGGVDWTRYLEADPASPYDGAMLPAWSTIVVAGHSQGGGDAAFLAQRFAVHRSVSLSAPNDSWSCTTAPCTGDCVAQGLLTMCPAAWVTSLVPQTSPQAMYGLGNTREAYYGAQTEPNNWAALGFLGPEVSVDDAAPPYAWSHRLRTSIANAHCALPGQICTALEEHDSTAVDGALQEVQGVPVLQPAWDVMLTGNGAD